jgi:hypothetical protein
MCENSSKLPILKDENYCYWKSQILSYCMEKNLDGYLLTNKAANAKDKAQREAWMDKKVSVAGVVGRHLSKDNTS